MGCLGLVFAGLLALAVPASIAPASLVGAYVVIGLLALAAGVAVVVVARRRPVEGVVASPAARLVLIAVLAAGYAAVVTAINAAS